LTAMTAHPTTNRENRSNITAKYSLPLVQSNSAGASIKAAEDSAEACCAGPPLRQVRLGAEMVWIETRCRWFGECEHLDGELRVPITSLTEVF
jgi:hypothetical protein